MKYGYCRISRKTQNIERQERNIIAEYPDAMIIKEAYTGTKIEGRQQLDKLLRMVKAGDMIIFDSASRMSRNAAEAVELYEDLFNRGIDLVFLKEHHIDTETYRRAIAAQIDLSADTGNAATDTLIESIIAALNRYTVDLAKEQIKLVFAQAQKEVDDLHQRTREGIKTAQLNGKQIGTKKGAKLNVKKATPAKEVIRKHSKDFGGTLKDAEVMKLAGIARNTYYKYKRELLEELKSA